jgi:hypothetical protein
MSTQKNIKRWTFLVENPKIDELLLAVAKNLKIDEFLRGVAVC